MSRSSGKSHTSNNSSKSSERLLDVDFMRATEEEKILNTVYPDSELEGFHRPISQQKDTALDSELTMMRVIPRGACCSHTLIDSFEEASVFR